MRSKSKPTASKTANTTADTENVFTLPAPPLFVPGKHRLNRRQQQELKDAGKRYAMKRAVQKRPFSQTSGPGTVKRSVSASAARP